MAHSHLEDTEAGRRLVKYWTKGEGLAKWIDKPHPWQALKDALIRAEPRLAGSPALDGLVSNLFKIATGHYPSQRHKGERL